MNDNLKTILESATEILGNEARALEWIDKKSETLGQSPRSLSETDEGRDAVLLHLRGIERRTRD